MKPVKVRRKWVLVTEPPEQGWAFNRTRCGADGTKTTSACSSASCRPSLQLNGVDSRKGNCNTDQNKYYVIPDPKLLTEKRVKL